VPADYAGNFHWLVTASFGGGFCGSSLRTSSEFALLLAAVVVLTCTCVSTVQGLRAGDASKTGQRKTIRNVTAVETPPGYKVFTSSATFLSLWAGIAYSVERLATGWTASGSNPGGSEIFRTRPDLPWGPRSLLYNGYRVSFVGVKRPGRGVNHPPYLAPTLKKMLSYSSISPVGFLEFSVGMNENYYSELEAVM
jgi:hypothetical protein